MKAKRDVGLTKESAGIADGELGERSGAGQVVVSGARG